MTVRITRLLLFFLCLLTLLFVACSSQPAKPVQPTRLEAQRIEESVDSSELQQNPLAAQRELDKALKHYSAIDDVDSATRLHLKMARLALQNSNKSKAQRHLTTASSLISAATPAKLQFDYLILDGRIQGKTNSYQRALDIADNPVDKGVALTYLGRHTHAFEQISNIIDPAIEQSDDLAFIQYSFARQNNDRAAAFRALAFYKAADNHIGITDSLFLSARIYQQQGDAENARHYMQRALLVSRAIGDTYRSNAIQKAMGTL